MKTADAINAVASARSALRVAWNYAKSQAEQSVIAVDDLAALTNLAMVVVVEAEDQLMRLLHGIADATASEIVTACEMAKELCDRAIRLVMAAPMKACADA